MEKIFATIDFKSSVSYNDRLERDYENKKFLYFHKISVSFPLFSSKSDFLKNQSTPLGGGNYAFFVIDTKRKWNLLASDIRYFSFLKTFPHFLELTSVIDLSSFSSAPVEVPLVNASLSILTNWIATHYLNWIDFLHGMGVDDMGKMEHFINFFVGNLNDNVFNGILWGDANLVDFVFSLAWLFLEKILVRNYWSKEDFGFLNSKNGENLDALFWLITFFYKNSTASQH